MAAELFASAPLLLRHSGVMLLAREEDHLPPYRAKVIVWEFQWSHPGIRPCGKDIGIQCSHCGGIMTSSNADHGREKPVIATCEMCCVTTEYTFEPKFSYTKSGESGHWYVGEEVPVPAPVHQEDEAMDDALQ